ncbi:MAG: N-formylglutamate amidohydrolase [Hyphomicrobiales bacterium]|nr:N-formylglutamate amidohydrolase [Hyphomicrobiales bacterium]
MSSTLTDSFSPAFDVTRPASWRHPAVFNSPHSGSIYPGGLQAMTRLDPLTLRKSEDCYIDKLFQGVADLGCPLLAARFPRVFLDVNREPYEFDPAMFDCPLPTFVNTSSLRVVGGLGTIPRIVSENETIYAQDLTWADANDRIERVYRPYHHTLAGLIEEARQEFGQAILIDCHSMPSSAARLSSSRGQPRADIVLGDRYGASCDHAITRFLESLFADAGLSVVHNKPYAGGYITQAYGSPQSGKHALQIEINRALYMDERTLEMTSGYLELHHILSDVLDQFVTALGDLLNPVSVAAE